MDKKFSKSSEFHYIGFVLYPSFTGIHEVLKTLIQGRHNHSESCITVKVCRRMQKNEVHLETEGSVHAISNTDVGYSFWSGAGIEFEVMLRKNTSETRVCFSYNLRIHFLMISSRLIENHIENKKLLGFVVFLFSTLKVGNIIIMVITSNIRPMVCYNL